MPSCCKPPVSLLGAGDPLNDSSQYNPVVPHSVGYNGSAVHGMGNMMQFLKTPAHSTNTTPAGTEARHESDSFKKQLNLPNLWGLIQLLKICLYPVKAITSDTISCKGGKSTISGLTEQQWQLGCNSPCSADWRERSQGSRKIHPLKIKRCSEQLHLFSAVWKQSC